MKESEKFRRKSIEFAGNAATSSLADMKIQYLAMAAAYKRLADNAVQREGLLDSENQEEQ